MDSIVAFLQRVAFTVNEQEFLVGQLLAVPLFLVLAYLLVRWGGRVIVRRLTERKLNQDLVHLIKRVFYVLAIAVVVITLLDLINVPLTAFAFISGAVAIGVGFGAQNIINNFISGWILMWERPIRIGDFLEVGSDKGTVEAINTRSTRIRRVDGVHMLIPNSALLENTVVNWTLVDRLARSVVRVGVAYGSPVRKVSELIEQAVNEESAVLSEPAPVVIFEDFGDSSLVFDVYYWIQAGVDRDLRVIRSNVRFRIDELFAENGIVIAFPQRDVHLDGTLQLLPNQDGR
ncbi:MAG: mechanosensitive ion channel [Pseudomonadaceae bacterium]|nr:mechanosensitive ion channel [Pseudomonadaceae bacterium]